MQELPHGDGWIIGCRCLLSRCIVLLFRLFAEKLVYLHAGLPQNRTERALGHVSRMIRNRRITAQRFVEPDLVGASRLTVEP